MSVDDKPENLEMLKDILSIKGYQVHPAINGEVALKAAQKAPPDLILLDIVMPGIDGYEVCRQLKANENTRDIPVLFLSAMDKMMGKIKAFEVGGVDYITKPFEVGEVLARVETHLTLRNMQRHLQEQNIRLQQELSERKKAEEALQQRNRELLLLNRVGQMFSSSLEFEHVLDIILGEIQRLLDAFSLSFWLIDNETDELVCLQAKGPGSEDIVRQRLASGQGITDWVAQQGENLIIPDTWDDEGSLVIPVMSQEC